MECFAIRKLCFMMGSLGLIASSNVGAFPSAAWYPDAPGTVVTFVINSGADGIYTSNILPKPAYINGRRTFVMPSGGSIDFFSRDNSGFDWHANRDLNSSPVCTLVFSPPVHVPDDITLGTPYTTTGTATNQCAGGGNESASFTITITPQAFEDVATAGAGTYRALKSEYQFLVGGTFGFTETGYSWRVPKIGEIKFQSGETDSAIAISSNVPDVGNADFDDDGRSDRAVFRPADGTWRIRLSSSNTDITRPWGIVNDRAVAADYDGDGKMDFAVWRPSNGGWYILKSSTNYTKTYAITHGLSTDQTVQRDYDGDGVTDIAVFRPSNGTWYVRTSSTGFTTGFTKQFGLSGDVVVPRDFDGDGKADLAVFRNGKWYVSTSSSGYNTTQTYSWGIAGDQPIARDFDGDGKADLALYRPTNGTWYITFSSTGYATSMTKAWGIPFAGTYDPSAGTSDIPVSGDFDGDRVNDIAVFRPSTGNWHVLTSSSNFASSLTLSSSGTTGDLPLSRK